MRASVCMYVCVCACVACGNRQREIARKIKQAAKKSFQLWTTHNKYCDNSSNINKNI